MQILPTCRQGTFGTCQHQGHPPSLALHGKCREQPQRKSDALGAWPAPGASAPKAVAPHGGQPSASQTLSACKAQGAHPRKQLLAVGAARRRAGVAGAALCARLAL